jgi:LuxR family quorum sensing-dependent transcriptional regulator
MPADPPAIERVFEFVEQCADLATPEAVLERLQNIVAELGFSFFILTGRPAGWFERYASQDYFQIDPVGQNVLATSSPFRWDAAPYRKDQDQARQMMGEAVEFGLKDGFCVPIYTATGWQSVFSFASAHRLDLGRKEFAAAHLLAITAHGKVRTLSGQNDRLRQKLTHREREVLTWAAAGKSAWETSSILRISEATVVTHLDNIRRKLDVANTTQAVVVALQTGELQPY